MSESEVERFYSEFGHRVRLARERRNITQAQLARAIGLTRSSVANLEAGRQKVLLHVLMIAAELLDVSPTDLLPSPTEQKGLSLVKLDEKTEALQEDNRAFVVQLVRTGIVGGGTDASS